MGGDGGGIFAVGGELGVGLDDGADATTRRYAFICSTCCSLPADDTTLSAEGGLVGGSGDPGVSDPFSFILLILRCRALLVIADLNLALFATLPPPGLDMVLLVLCDVMLSLAIELSSAVLPQLPS